MSADVAPNPEEIHRSIAMLKELRPAYREILDFHGEVLIAQMESSHRIEPAMIQFPPDDLSVKFKAGLPLIFLHQFAIDSEACAALLERLCRIAQKANATMADSANSIMEALDRHTIGIDLLFEKLVTDSRASMEAISNEIKAQVDVLSFLTYSSVIPSIEEYVRRLLEDGPKAASWTRGDCPVCGSAAGLAILGEKGNRILVCHFCRHKWAAQRMFCPFCENREQKTLQYFYSEDEPEYRIDTCNRCHTYLKTVDVRQVDRIVHLPLEQAATLHLDLLVREKGFKPPEYRFCN